MSEKNQKNQPPKPVDPRDEVMRRIRIAFSPVEQLDPSASGALVPPKIQKDQNFGFFAQKDLDLLTWTDQKKQILLKAIETFGFGRWVEMVQVLLPNWDPNSLINMTCKLYDATKEEVCEQYYGFRGTPYQFAKMKLRAELKKQNFNFKVASSSASPNNSPSPSPQPSPSKQTIFENLTKKNDESKSSDQSQNSQSENENSQPRRKHTLVFTPFVAATRAIEHKTSDLWVDERAVQQLVNKKRAAPTRTPGAVQRRGRGGRSPSTATSSRRRSKNDDFVSDEEEEEEDFSEESEESAESSDSENFDDDDDDSSKKPANKRRKITTPSVEKTMNDEEMKALQKFLPKRELRDRRLVVKQDFKKFFQEENEPIEEEEEGEKEENEAATTSDKTGDEQNNSGINIDIPKCTGKPEKMEIDEEEIRPSN